MEVQKYEVKIELTEPMLGTVPIGLGRFGFGKFINSNLD